MLLTTRSLAERGLDDVGPIALDLLTYLASRDDWGEPGFPPSHDLRAAAIEAAAMTAERNAAE